MKHYPYLLFFLFLCPFVLGATVFNSTGETAIPPYQYCHNQTSTWTTNYRDWGFSYKQNNASGCLTFDAGNYISIINGVFGIDQNTVSGAYDANLTYTFPYPAIIYANVSAINYTIGSIVSQKGCIFLKLYDESNNLIWVKSYQASYLSSCGPAVEDIETDLANSTKQWGQIINVSGKVKRLVINLKSEMPSGGTHLYVNNITIYKATEGVATIPEFELESNLTMKCINDITKKSTYNGVIISDMDDNGFYYGVDCNYKENISYVTSFSKNYNLIDDGWQNVSCPYNTMLIDDLDYGLNLSSPGCLSPLRKNIGVVKQDFELTFPVVLGLENKGVEINTYSDTGESVTSIKVLGNVSTGELDFYDWNGSWIKHYTTFSYPELTYVRLTFDYSLGLVDFDRSLDNYVWYATGLMNYSGNISYIEINPVGVMSYAGIGNFKTVKKPQRPDWLTATSFPPYYVGLYQCNYTEPGVYTMRLYGTNDYFLNTPEYRALDYMLQVEKDCYETDEYILPDTGKPNPQSILTVWQLLFNPLIESLGIRDELDSIVWVFFLICFFVGLILLQRITLSLIGSGLILFLLGQIGIGSLQHVIGSLIIIAISLALMLTGL